MRITFSILALCFATVLTAQTIDQKLDKLAAKGYVKKEYISSVKQIIKMKEDSVTEGSILFFLYTGDANSNNSGVLLDYLTKIKKATKSNPIKVLKDMVDIGLIENDSSVAWIKREMKHDTDMMLKYYIDIYKYLYLAGQYEDAVRPCNLSSVLQTLDTANLISKKDSADLMTLARKKKLNNLWDVFVRCKNVSIQSQLPPADNALAIQKILVDVAGLYPELSFTNIKVTSKHIGYAFDSIFINVTCEGHDYYEAYYFFNDKEGWAQIEKSRIYQVMNKIATKNGMQRRIYEVTLESKISGANTKKALWALTGEEHYQLQQIQATKSGNTQLFKLYPN